MPVSSKVYKNLINTETDAKRLESLTQIYNKLAPQETVTLDSPAPASPPPPPSPEIREIPQENEAVSENIPDESGMELLAKLRENVAPGPPRTKTTDEERTAVKEWGLRNPNADPNQRKDLAASLGLTKLTVDRLVVYANKINTGSKFSFPVRYKHTRPQRRQADPENVEQNGKRWVGNQKPVQLNPQFCNRVDQSRFLHSVARSSQRLSRRHQGQTKLP